MIDEATFKDFWALLCERFHRDPSPLLAMGYYRSLSPRMTTAEFQAAAQKVFEEREFFPRPADFLAAALPDPDALALEREREALDQWDEFLKVMRGFGRQAKLTDESRRIIRQFGGETALGNTPLDSVPFVRREFLKLYGEAERTVLTLPGRRFDA